MSGGYRLVGITNSLRHASFNRMALALAATSLPAGTSLQIADLQDIPFYDLAFDASGFPEPVERLAGALLAADGIVLACPEYNHSIPGVTKNAIDCLSRFPGDPLRGKPVMLLSATKGMLGGARVQYELRRVLDSVGALPMVRPEVFISMAHLKFDESGACIDPNTQEFVRTQAAEFCKWIARTQRWKSREPEQA